VLVGSHDFIAKAHRYRKLLGGGMRQAGVIAAAGLVAVREMLGRLGEDHARATRLAHKLIEISGVNVNLDSVQTNMVYFNVDRERVAAPELAQAMAEQGVKCNALGPATIRLVVHYQIDDADIDRAVSVIASCLRRDAVSA
jgi:threonine aldolase